MASFPVRPPLLLSERHQKAGLFSAPHSAPKTSRANHHTHHTTTPPSTHKVSANAGTCRVVSSSYLWKIITVLMPAADGSVRRRRGRMRVTDTKNRAGGGLGGHCAGFQEAYACIGVDFISVNTSRLKMDNYSVSIAYEVSRLQLCYQDNFHDRDYRAPISHRRGAESERSGINTHRPKTEPHQLLRTTPNS